MYIKTVSLKGFKTYYNQTALPELSPHTNLVIGANGNGKSNFFTALRFVLTDHYSTLRRDERQGLIYQGSGSVMSASVEIVFSDIEENFILPPGVKLRSNGEVSIRRTVGLKKDDFQVNDRNVTRAEVGRMLESGGISMTHSYNVVPQGKIVSVTNAKNHERLELLEEVVGAKTFEIKLKQSMKKMEETEIKRNQIEKEMNELNSKLSEMKEEKEELEKYNLLERDRKVFQYSLYDRELNDIINQIEKLTNDYNSIINSSENDVQQLEKREILVEEMTNEINDLEDELKIKNNSEFQQYKLKKKEMEKNLAKLKVKIDDLKNEIKSYSEQSKIDQKNLKLINELINEKKEELSNINPQYMELNSKEIKFENKFETLSQRKRDILLKKGKYSNFSNKEERDLWIQMEIDTNKGNLNELELEETTLKGERTNYETKLNEINETIEELKDNVEGPGTIAELNDLENEYKKIEEEYLIKIDERKKLWRNENKLENLLENQIENIKKHERNLNETLDRSLSLGINNVKEIAIKLNIRDDQIFGTLGELIKVSEKYKKCVEVIGGNSLFNIVVDNEETASKIMKELIRMDNGRVTFMPLNRLKENDNIKYPSNEENVNCTALIKKIKFDNKYIKAIRHVFGRTIVVKDLNDGNHISKKYKLNCVTLDGDRIDNGGVVSGGYYNMNKGNKIDNLKSLKKCRVKCSITQNEINEIKLEIEKVDNLIDKINGELNDIGKKKEIIKKNIEENSNVLKMRIKNKYEIEEEIDRIQLIKLKRVRFKIKEIKDKIDKYEEDISKEFHNEISDEEEIELNEINKELNELKIVRRENLIEYESMSNKIDEIRSELDNKLIPQEREIKMRINTKDEEEDYYLIEMKEKCNKLENERDKLVDEMGINKEEMIKMEEDISSIKNKIKKLRDNLNNNNEIQKVLVNKLEEYQQRVEQYMIKRTTLIERREDLQTKIREVGLINEEVLIKYQDKNSEYIIKLLEISNKKLDKFKNVNKRAFENYKKFNDKREELKERSNELVDSKDSIKELIDKLREQKVNAVDSTFEKVSNNFSKIFEKIVPNGIGKLIIHKNEDPNEEERYKGVSIRVSFNDKDEGLLVEQLSGGQKTVCAISLILAIQQVEPAPFYLFDEIDAALDKQYRVSISKLIQEMSTSAQFICTTFRSEMVDIADRIYRVRYENRSSNIDEIDGVSALKIIKGRSQMEEV